MSLVENIIANKAGYTSVEIGDLVDVAVDRIYVQDGNTPTIAKLFDQYGFKNVQHCFGSIGIS